LIINVILWQNKTYHNVNWMATFTSFYWSQTVFMYYTRGLTYYLDKALAGFLYVLRCALWYRTSQMQINVWKQLKWLG
jgi:hypothetical protein